MSDPIQFDRVDPVNTGEATSIVCTVCKRSIEVEYYVLSGKVICNDCHARIQALTSGSSRSVVQPLWRGSVAALVGAGIYYGVFVFTGYQIGLIAVLVGYLVGKAVRQGAGGLGGRRDQVFAVLLTYASIALTYLPPFRHLLWKSLHLHYWGVLSSVLGYVFAFPILHGIKSITGLFILAIALWEAWRLNEPRPLQIEGPFKVGRSTNPS